MPHHTDSTYTYPEADPVAILFKLGWTREDFASAMGVTRQTVDRWACGIRRPDKMARRLAAELAPKN